MTIDEVLEVKTTVNKILSFEYNPLRCSSRYLTIEIDIDHRTQAAHIVSIDNQYVDPIRLKDCP